MTGNILTQLRSYHGRRDREASIDILLEDTPIHVKSSDVVALGEKMGEAAIEAMKKPLIQTKPVVKENLESWFQHLRTTRLKPHIEDMGPEIKKTMVAVSVDEKSVDAPSPISAPPSTHFHVRSGVSEECKHPRQCDREALDRAWSRRAEMLDAARGSLKRETNSDVPQGVGFRVDPTIVDRLQEIQYIQLEIDTLCGRLGITRPNYELDPLIAGLLNVIRAMRPVVEAAIEFKNARVSDRASDDPQVKRFTCPAFRANLSKFGADATAAMYGYDVEEVRAELTNPTSVLRTRTADAVAGDLEISVREFEKKGISL